MFFPRPVIALLALSLMAQAACMDGLPSGAENPVAVDGRVSAPPGAPEGSCWARHVTPAVIETRIHQAVARPAEYASDGTLLRPPLYHSETRQEIVTPRRETLFETVCPERLTPEFITSLQRALAVRGLLGGHASGVLDAPTRRAIRTYQAGDGIASDILSLQSARRIGLVAIPRAEQG